MFLKLNTDIDIRTMLNDLPEGEVKFSQWEKEDVNTNGNIVKKMRLHELIMEKQQFSEYFAAEFSSLRHHVRRVHTQYEQISKLRNNLHPLSQVTCQMDYSENFNVVYQDEPNQVFYDRRQITLHPMEVHYRDMDGCLCHKSFVGLSDERLHSAATTAAFIERLIPEILEFLPQLEVIHYVTDSPASQYRNKSIIKLVSQHKIWYNGVDCTWEFLETGHGKGPCDGVGGGGQEGGRNLY
jgi:hypothetical protein